MFQEDQFTNKHHTKNHTSTVSKSTKILLQFDLSVNLVMFFLIRIQQSTT
uniref:Uncharacterized protein n=1 Tax=Rhizophora mucronata TaxID=61149 RepID=A0A2P2NT90_RHIMU